MKVQGEISGGISLANKLNVSNGRAEWSTMNALIQGVRKNFGDGTTEVQVGVAKHLGVQEIANLLRMWRFRRVWQNPAARASGSPGGGGASLGVGRNIPKHNTHAGVEEPSEFYVMKRPDGAPTGTPTGEIHLKPKKIETTLGAITPVALDSSDPPHVVIPREICFRDDAGNKFYAIAMVGGGYTKA